MKKITIQDMPKHIGETVKIGAWLANKRSSGKIVFLQLRDGYGFVQAVVVKEQVGEEFNVTRERVRQIEQKVIQKLKEHAGLQKILGIEDDIAKLEANE